MNAQREASVNLELYGTIAHCDQNIVRVPSALGEECALERNGCTGKDEEAVALLSSRPWVLNCQCQDGIIQVKKDSSPNPQWR